MIPVRKVPRTFRIPPVVGKAAEEKEEEEELGGEAAPVVAVAVPAAVLEEASSSSEEEEDDEARFPSTSIALLLSPPSFSFPSFPSSIPPPSSPPSLFSFPSSFPPSLPSSSPSTTFFFLPPRGILIGCGLTVHSLFHSFPPFNRASNASPSSPLSFIFVIPFAKANQVFASVRGLSPKHGGPNNRTINVHKLCPPV